MFFFENLKFWPCKFSFSPDPVILDLKLQPAEKKRKSYYNPIGKIMFQFLFQFETFFKLKMNKIYFEYKKVQIFMNLVVVII